MTNYVAWGVMSTLGELLGSFCENLAAYVNFQLEKLDIWDDGARSH